MPRSLEWLRVRRIQIEARDGLLPRSRAVRGSPGPGRRRRSGKMPAEGGRPCEEALSFGAPFRGGENGGVDVGVKPVFT